MENDEKDIKNHENMIEIETVFVCEICTRDFNDRASLWLHIRATHKEFAAFACGVCLKICADNTQLMNHLNMYHVAKLSISEQRRYHFAYIFLRRLNGHFFFSYLHNVVSNYTRAVVHFSCFSH